MIMSQAIRHRLGLRDALIGGAAVSVTLGQQLMQKKGEGIEKVMIIH